MPRLQNSTNDLLGAMRCFIRVASTGSFSAVAKEKSVSTSTVTRKIAQLEEHLKVNLLNRSTHDVSLTEAGRLYYNRILPVLYDIDDAERLVTDLHETPGGSLKLTAPVAFGRLYISPLIPGFLACYPDIRLDLRLTDNHNDLVEGGFDLDVHEGERYLDDLIVHKITANRSVICASESYLNNFGTPLHPEDLSHHNLIEYVHPEAPRHWVFGRDNETFTNEVRGNFRTDHSETLLNAALHGVGIAEMEIWLAQKFIHTGELVHLLSDWNMDNPLTGQHIYLAHLPNRRNSVKVKVLKDYLIGALSSIFS